MDCAYYHAGHDAGGRYGKKTLSARIRRIENRSANDATFGYPREVE